MKVKGILKVQSQEDSLLSCAPSPSRARRSGGLSAVLRSLKYDKTQRREIARMASKKNAKVSSPTKTKGQELQQGGHQKVENETGATRVQFQQLQIREYKTLAEINPGVSKGPALGIGWEFRPLDTLSVDEYESTRQPRLKLKEMKLSQDERIRRLKSQGMSVREIKETVRKTNAARAKRKKTLEGMSNEKTAEAMESALHKVLKLMRRRKSAEVGQEELWDVAQMKSKRLVALTKERRATR